MKNEKKNEISRTGLPLPWWAIAAGFIVNPYVGLGLLVVRVTGINKKLAVPVRNIIQRGRQKRLALYMAVIGDRKTMSTKRIASALNQPLWLCEASLGRLISSGCYEGVYQPYIDKSQHLFVLDAAYAPDEEGPIYTEFTEHEPEAPRPEPETTGELPAEYEKKLAELRRMNDLIDDDFTSAAIDHIENVTRSIFAYVHLHPDKNGQIQSFMNYYLPATMKLLGAYAELEKQPSYVENVASSRAKIEETLEKSVAAFDKLLNKLYEAEAMDIATDIKVMESMMARDGLGGDKYTMPKL